jgi:signal transduction histidine kinase
MTKENMFHVDPDFTADRFQNIPLEYVNDQILLDILPILFHKLKNKLTPILGYVQILKANSREDFLRSRLQRIEDNASEMSDLLNTLKDYFRIDKKAKRPGNLNRVLKSLSGLFRRIEKEQKVRIMLELDPKIPDDMLFAGEIETLILSLVDNALTAVRATTAAEKNVWIRTESEEGQYRLRVRDSGNGIPAEEQEKIWSPFFSRFSNRTGDANPIPRPGLGLTVCERIAANHEAKIVLNSEPGTSCEFIAIFPRPSIPEKPKVANGPKRSRGRSAEK